jgi:hypothetical protein
MLFGLENEKDKYLILSVAAGLILWNIMVSTHLSTPYPAILIELYALPITRIILLALVLLITYWNPVIGVLTAFAYITLGADVLFFTQTRPTKEKEQKE